MATKNDKAFLMQIQHLEDDEIIEKILEYVNTNFANRGTRANRLSLLKKCVIENEILNDISNAWKIGDPTLYQELNQQREINCPKLRTQISRKYINTLIDCKDSDNKFELLFYLLLITGRRVSEFLNGEFKLIADTSNKGQYHLYILNLSKKRNIESQDSNGYHIQLLYETPTNFMTLLSKFNTLRTKSNGKQMTHASIVSAGCVCINKLLDQQLKIKDLRPMYIALSKLKPEHKNKIGSSLVQELLNHENRSVSIFYNDKFEIID